MPGTGKLAIAAIAAFLAIASAPPAASASGEGGALVVGDSLEELTSPYLKRFLPGVPLTVNAVGGYNSYQIFDLFQESYDPSHSVVVFAAGTNDNPAYPEILAGNLDAVANSIGDRCMVVPTIHGLTVDGIDNEGKNRVVAEFATARPGTQVPDWAGAVATHPELMQPDDLHPTAEGAELRARLIAQGIKACLGVGTASAREPVLRPRPEMSQVGKIARRQASVAMAIAGGLLSRIAGHLVGREQALAAALALIALRGECEDPCDA